MLIAKQKTMPQTSSQPALPKLTWRPKLLDRYVAGEFLFSYLIVTAVLVSLRLLIDLFLYLDEFVEPHSAAAAVGVFTVLGRIFDYYAPQTLAYFRDFSGWNVVVAAAFALMRMKRQNELTAVLASGVSLKRLIAPVVLLGFALNLLMVLDQELILPRFADQLVRRHDETEQLRMVPIYFVRDQDGSLLCAVQFDPQQRVMHNMLLIRRADRRMIGKLTAEQAHWDEANQHWNLVNGRYEAVFDADAPATDQQHVPVDIYQSDHLTADYLWLQRNARSKSLMSIADLNAIKPLLKEADRREAESEIHFRFTDPIINMVMLLMGLPLLISRERRSTKTAIFLCLIGAGGCFVTTFACKLLVGTGVPVLSDPLISAWVPIIIFLPVSVLALDALKT